MKLVTFEAGGSASYGALAGDGIIDLGKHFGSRYPDLRAVLEAGALPELAQAAASLPATLTLAGVRLLPVIPNPQKIFCVGLNYKTHVAETKRADSDYPAIFTRFADTLVAHGAPLVKPKISERFDFEGELAVVIGKGGRNITQANAFEHIAGYASFNDGSVRDWQRHTHQWTPGKNFPGTGAFGPCLTTRDEVPDLDAQSITTRLNGQVVQQATFADLIFTIPVIIEYLSRFTPLLPGDVIATGTPGGVGDRREPPLYMKDGDVIEVDISSIGLLRNTVKNET
ncbi:MAG: 5-carboxymethyl-2-hydroxymuconate Delta-isomerase [Polaromonas sp.]|nr:5-carboxymethyl-2-hydroxymuconate Delta-isomerase [Polaromonas sp.]